jgi:hypothetical protein
MAERTSGKTLMPKPAGQPRLPRITQTTAHITIILVQRNGIANSRGFRGPKIQAWGTQLLR